MGRIKDRFAALAARNEAAFIPYLTAGDPDLGTTCALARAAEASPNEVGTWRALREVGQRVGAWEELARVLRVGVASADAETAADLALWLAEIESEQLGLEDGRERALVTLREAAARLPEHVGVHEAIARYEILGEDAGAVEEAVAALTDLIEDDAMAAQWWRAVESAMVRTSQSSTQTSP